MNEILNAILIAVFAILSLAACLSLLPALFPRRVERTRAALERSPGRSFVIGAVNLFFFLALALALASSGGDAGRLLAILVLLLPLAGAGLGLAALCGLAGERLFPASSPFLRGAQTSLLIGLSWIFPFLGWFLLLPGMVTAGLGAWVLSFFRRET